MMASTCQPKKVHITAGIFSVDNLYLAGEIPILVSGMAGNFGGILPETSKNSASPKCMLYVWEF